MKRLMEKTVFLGLVTAWFLAALPTMRSPSARKPTTDGVVRSPSAFTIVVGVPPSRTAIAELVVPRSIPRILLIVTSLPWVAWRAFADAHGASAFCSWHSVSPYAATYTKSKSIHIRFLILHNSTQGIRQCIAREACPQAQHELRVPCAHGEFSSNSGASAPTSIAKYANAGMFSRPCGYKGSTIQRIRR